MWGRVSGQEAATNSYRCGPSDSLQKDRLQSCEIVTKQEKGSVELWMEVMPNTFIVEGTWCEGNQVGHFNPFWREDVNWTAGRQDDVLKAMIVEKRAKGSH